MPFGTEIANKILSSIIVVVAFYLLGTFSKKIISRTVHNSIQRYRATKRVSLLIGVSALLVIGMIWAEALGSIITMLGLLSAGIALALKDPISSIVGWFHINSAKLYSVGDRIEIGGVKGDVIDISMLTTSMIEIGNWVDGEQSTGRLVKVPNNWVFTKETFNYTQAFPYVWTELAITITFESDYKKAVEIYHQVLKKVVGNSPREVEQAIRRAQEKFLIHYRNFDPIVYIKIADSGVNLVGRFLVNVRQRRSMESKVFDLLLNEINATPEVELAYTTYRIVN